MNKRKSAFTLIEIMVATVIMVVLVGLVIQITSEVLNVWNRSAGKLSANAEARIAMDLITQDLETAVFRDNDQQWLRVESPKTPGGPYTNQTVALKLFASPLDRSTTATSDVCAIGYRLQFQEAYEGATEKVYGLYRYVVDPDVTFESVMGSSSEGSNSAQLSLSGGVWDDAVITEDVNYLAGNIIEFRVLLYVDDGSGVPQALNWDENSYQISGDYAYGGTGATPITDKLLYADILLTVVTDEGLKLLQRFDEGGGGTGYDDINDVVREHGEVFARRVNFLSVP